MKIEKIDAIQLSTDDAKKYIATIINENYAQNPTIIKYLGGGSFGSAFYVQISNAEMVSEFVICFVVNIVQSSCNFICKFNSFFLAQEPTFWVNKCTFTLNKFHCIAIEWNNVIRSS